MKNIPCKSCGYEPPKRIRAKRFRSESRKLFVLKAFLEIIKDKPWFVSIGCNPTQIVIEVTNTREAWNDDDMVEQFMGFEVIIVCESNRVSK